MKLFEIHKAGACVVRLAETAISIADKDDPNLVRIFSITSIYPLKQQQRRILYWDLANMYFVYATLKGLVPGFVL